MSTEEPQVTISIRDYKPEDKEAVSQIFRDGLMHYSTIEGQSEALWHGFIEHCLQEDFAGTCISSGGDFWVATALENGEETVVGLVGFERKSDEEGELRRMSVKSSHRRHGVGRLLVAHLLDWAKAHDFKKVWLSSGDVMAPLAHKFYLSLGFTLQKIEPLPEDPTVQLHFFEKKLE
ncbi:hypothetical protein Poli38472_009969 [Pythium oligandrum]|uniref:N-acetyltransferase domain-containing protein n=1 Tax=Pythium oligandrum TaxID=41045 RepID=A0A8K1FCK4_PYTOL|nr:hypothetical protein Poli38472_009969 [Pythium oligandrum]|eukprot:TMW58410.1 hypothetical protein Poli38472_009969 [Pythium oligandrum]